MIISLIFKAILYYVIFMVIRGLWNAYKGYKFIKANAQEAFKQSQHQHGGFEGFSESEQGHRAARATKGNDVEAEYRVVDK